MFLAILIISVMMNTAPAAKSDAVKSTKTINSSTTKAVEEEFKSLESSSDETEVINVDTDTAPATVETPTATDKAPADAKSVQPKPDQAKIEPKTETKPVEVKPAEVKPAKDKALVTKPEPKPEAKPEVKSEAKPEVKKDTVPEAKPEVKAAEVKTAAQKKENSLNKEILEVTEENGVSAIKKYYIIDDKGNKLLVRKELDLNGDGKTDYVYYYDNKKPTDERVEKIVVDNDFDGKFDETRYYNPDNGQLVRKEMDLNFDGQPEIIKRYYNGQLVKKEVDTNLDGVMDYWEYYQDGKLVRVEVDTDGDGKPDKIGKTEVPEVYKFDINEVDKNKNFDETPKMTGTKTKKGLRSKKTGTLKAKKTKKGLKKGLKKKPKLLKKKRLKKKTGTTQEQQGAAQEIPQENAQAPTNP